MSRKAPVQNFFYSNLSQNSPIIWRKTGDKTSSKRSKIYPRLQWRIQGGKGRILKDFFTIEQSVICFPNCVQIWKGRDWKMVFCRVRQKNGKPKVKPCKELFSDRNFSVWEQILQPFWGSFRVDQYHHLVVGLSF